MESTSQNIDIHVMNEAKSFLMSLEVIFHVKKRGESDINSVERKPLIIF